MRKFVLSTLTGVAVLCFVCLPALAQTTGTIRGRIKDADGAPLPGLGCGQVFDHSVCTGSNSGNKRRYHQDDGSPGADRGYE